MSAPNGNGRIAKFHRRVALEVGLKGNETLPYAPDFLDSLVQRMRTSDCWEEAVFAWMEYRCSNNQSLEAIHLYGRKGEATTETHLRQRDCCLDLAWLRAGHRAEWLDAPIEIFRAEAARRGVVPIARDLVCQAFADNRKRGTIASGTGYVLVLVPSPVVGHSSEQKERKGESAEYREFCAQWEVGHSSEVLEERVARSIINRINKVRLSDYKKWRKLRAHPTNGAPSLEAIETVETLEAAPSAPPAAEQPRIYESDPPPAGGRATEVATVVEESRENPPARPPAAGVLSEKKETETPQAPPPEWHPRLREILKKLPLGTHLDEAMFQRIASHLTEQLLDQFKTEATRAAPNIQKWSGYEGVAKQVEARGPIEMAPTAPGGAREDPLVKELREEQERRRVWETG